MMSKALFEKLEFVARKMKKNELPFGGVTLVLCGDFFQLPPVSRGGASVDEARFCFESEAWGRCLRAAAGGPENTFSLNEVFRQKDGRLLRLLSEVRHNSLTPQGLRLLEDLRRELGVGRGGANQALPGQREGGRREPPEVGRPGGRTGQGGHVRGHRHPPRGGRCVMSRPRNWMRCSSFRVRST
ncbi:unnamed protein product [Prorocentrum cordatum]|uniref:ATP-dependent DNA helicase n=1 Tax=Prorocentrum cordatum TaxID=2364126 RepID=A0ABN9XS25_9DINO|nr:unnamed protein product [Polarella glacialis]